MLMIPMMMIDGENDDNINEAIELVTVLNPHPRKNFFNLRERETSV